MKRLLTILLLFPLVCFSQYDSTKNRQQNSAYGFDFKNIGVSGSLIIPNDTPRLAVKDSNAIASLNGKAYIWNGQRWNSFVPDSDPTKLNISDTLAMLSGYVRRQELIDTAAAIRADFPTGGGGGSGNVSVKIQLHTSGTTVLVQDTSTWLIVDPGSLLATLTITTPAAPQDGQQLDISFGGTITSGNVVTSLTVSPNTGQSIIQASTPSVVEAGEKITYRYSVHNSKWYRL